MKPKIIVLLVGLLIGGLGFAALQCTDAPIAGANSDLRRFSSYGELNEFVKKKMESFGRQAGGEEFYWDTGGAVLRAAEGANSAYGGGSIDYSTTNIQVEGVDEADIVKTDGEFIYLVSGEEVIIVQAYPPENARVLSRIELDERPEGLFINGDRLIVLHQSRDQIAVPEEGYEERLPLVGERPGYRTCIKVYDVSDRENPLLKRDFAVDGRYYASRMVDDYVYAVTGLSAVIYDGEVRLPEIHADGSAEEIPASQIYYCNVTDYSYSFTNIVAVNTQKDSQKPVYETLLVGASSNIYVSLDNIYITSPEWWAGENRSERTAIHRIEIKSGQIECKASGEVPGRPLNQFSMDEYGGFFRVATTTSNMVGNGGEPARGNHVFVLDMQLDTVGRLEDLAPGESIYAARFMGDRCYLVTFKQIDPFFVIDLRDPYTPKVLGELKIPGYSNYLHPYDENHVIGIGKETGVKISLFDVSDVANPKEMAKHEIGGRGTDSPVLRDHKALLFDRARNLLVMPVSVTDNSSYYRFVWQGVYVFVISPDKGIQIKGRISHYDDDADLAQEENLFSSPKVVERSLYIEDILYTISEKKIKMNSLENLDYIGEVEIGG